MQEKCTSQKGHCVVKRQTCVKMGSKMVEVFVLGIVISFISSQTLGGVSMSDEKRLITHLLENYEKIGIVGRPVYNTSETVTVNFGLALLQILEMNSIDQTGTFSMWYRHSWNDIMLKWNPEDFGRVDHVRVPITKIWRPDIMLYNSVGPEKPTTDAMAVVSSDGSVLWILPVTVTVKCDSDGNFPFDTAHCHLKYGSWTYDGFKLDVGFYDGMEDMDLSDYIVVNNWALIRTTGIKNIKYYPCCAEPYPDLSFSMEFTRMSSSSSYCFVLPTVVLFLLMLVVFWLHPGSVSKFVIGGLVFFSFLFMMGNLAMFYKATKFMGWLGFGLVLTFTAMLTSVITSAVAKKGETGQALPQCLSMVCVRVFGLILCSDRPLQTNAGHSKDSKGVEKTDKARLRQEWVAFAQVLDRIAFLLHVVVLLIMAGANGKP